MTTNDHDEASSDDWSPLVPEMLVRDLKRSLAFYCDCLGFTEKFARPEAGFAYLELGRAQIMLEQLPEDMSQAWLPARWRSR